MSETIPNDLLWIAVVIGTLSAIVASRELPWSVAAPLTVLKMAIPLVYFTVCADQLWVELDDVSYFEWGQSLLRAGYNPVTVLFDPDGRELLFNLSEGAHVLYPWWNLLAQYLFGDHYYTSVFLNVLLTFVCAHVLSRLASDLGFSTVYRRWLIVFFLLHWDVVVWSSFVNLKDIAVLTLTLASFWFLVRLVALRQARYFVALVAMGLLFRSIRFYVPVLMGGATIAWIVTQWNDGRKYLVAAAAAVALYLLAPRLNSSGEMIRLSDLAFGTAQIVLTPAPWRNVEGSYLIIPSILHWIMLLPAIIGGLILWRSSPTARLFLFYMVIVCLFYGLVEELRGPRQRVQVVFVTAWIQFQFLWTLVTASLEKLSVAPATTMARPVVRSASALTDAA